MRYLLRLAMLMLLCATTLWGCAADTPTQQLTGILHGTPSMDGGPVSSWTLVMGEEGSGVGMPLDVSAVKSQADALNGQQVTITAQNSIGEDAKSWIVKKIVPASP